MAGGEQGKVQGDCCRCGQIGHTGHGGDDD